MRLHRTKLRVLTTIAFALGFLTLVTGLMIVWSYPLFILPQQKEMAWEARQLLSQYQTNSVAAISETDAGRQIGKLLAVQIDVTNVTTAATVVVTLAMGLLALGTLILLTVVVLNRRVALNQTSQNLVRISQ